MSDAANKKQIRTLSDFNKLLIENGVNSELVKGKGYFYYIGTGNACVDIPSVYVAHFSQMSSEQWTSELETAIEIFNNR